MLSPSLTSERLKHLIRYQNENLQKQCFAKDRRIKFGDQDLYCSIRIYGIGADRWHILCGENESYFLVSLFSNSKYLYINISTTPCPVFQRITNAEKNILSNFVSRKGETWLEPIKKKSQKDKKLERLKGFVEAMKRGESSSFANKIGKKIKK